VYSESITYFNRHGISFPSLTYQRRPYNGSNTSDLAELTRHISQRSDRSMKYLQSLLVVFSFVFMAPGAWADCRNTEAVNDVARTLQVVSTRLAQQAADAGEDYDDLSLLASSLAYRAGELASVIGRGQRTCLPVVTAWQTVDRTAARVEFSDESSWPRPLGNLALTADRVLRLSLELEDAMALAWDTTEQRRALD
jgi:hypothetical protein